MFNKEAAGSFCPCEHFAMGFRNPQRHKAARKKQEKPRSERANAKAARKAQSAAQAKTEELRNALQTRVEQGKAGLGCVPADED